MGWNKKLTRGLKRGFKAMATMGYSEIKPVREAYRKNSAVINQVAVAALTVVAPPAGVAAGMAVGYEDARKAASQAAQAERDYNAEIQRQESSYTNIPQKPMQSYNLPPKVTAGVPSTGSAKKVYSTEKTNLTKKKFPIPVPILIAFVLTLLLLPFLRIGAK